jgi:ectoine hydroxylase-related dioxygenase (phytanoyl-CoA dioxygenase family)
VDKERDRWDILSWDLTRGDLLVFHLATLHGGGGTVPGVTRKSLTLRFFSDDAVWTEPLPAPDPEAFSVKRNKAWAESGKRGPAVSVVPGEAMHLSGRFRSLG